MTKLDEKQGGLALVVDDNADALSMVSTALEQHGMTVLVARDGRSAINLTHRVHPDVILMDALMPEMSGFEACKVLKSGPNPVLAPIIFMTGLTAQEHVVQGLEAGGVDYITKPVEIDEMIARLSTHIVNYRLLQSARGALDSSNQSILAFDLDATLSWGTEHALEDMIEIRRLRHENALKNWVMSCRDQATSTVPPFSIAPYTFRYIGMSETNEILVRVVADDGGHNEEKLQKAFNLTHREAEVLYWLTLGKTNRDISTILSLSARTVNKHLEQVFQKMGVDNRTSAAVLADRELS